MSLTGPLIAPLQAEMHMLFMSKSAAQDGLHCLQVMSRELQAQGYYKKKGLVVEAPTPYVGEIEMLDSGDVLRVDQAQLETVLPALGGSIAVVVGKHRGQKGVMLAVHADDFQAEVELGDGTKLLLAYEDVCKLA